jgi:hypothetical protein
MKPISTLLAVTFCLGAGCSLLEGQPVSMETEEQIVGWRLVNYRLEHLERRHYADISQSGLVFEPILSRDDPDGILGGIVHLEAIASDEARVGEVITARISVPDADEDDQILVEVRSTNDWTKIDGPDRLVLRGPEVMTVRFTRSAKGKAEIRISAVRLSD